MSFNPEDHSVADVQERSEASMEVSTSNATIHTPSNLGSCAPTNPQSSVENAEMKYGALAQNFPDSNTTLGNRLHYLRNNEILSDVTFLVGEGAQQQRIPAHKLILSARSAVFHAMFNGALATTSLEIEVPDVEPTAFLAVLLFLYTDEFHGDPETVLMTLYAAKKYAVPQVEEYCVEFLKSNLSSSNAFMLLAQARFFNEPELASLCLNEIDKSTAAALNADGFTDIDIDTLILVLERETLWIEESKLFDAVVSDGFTDIDIDILMLILERETLRIQESKLFEAVVRWSEAECARQQLPVIPENQRTVLGKALYLVRFPLMSLETFAAGPAQSGILTDREIISLYQYFTLNPKPSVDFEVNPRVRMLGEKLRARRFKNYEYTTKRSFNSMMDVMSFTVDRRIFVVGFGVSSTAASSEVDPSIVYINLLHTSSGRVIASSYRRNCISYDKPLIYSVEFASPVAIEANIEYTAVANFNGPILHCGIQDLKTVIVDCDSTKEKVTFEFKPAFNRDEKSSDNGYVWDIIFYI